MNIILWHIIAVITASPPYHYNICDVCDTGCINFFISLSRHTCHLCQLLVTLPCHYDNIFLWHLPAIMTTTVCETYLSLCQHLSMTHTCHDDNICLWHLPVIMTSVYDTYLPSWHFLWHLPAILTFVCDTTCHDVNICLWHLPIIMTTSVCDTYLSLWQHLSVTPTCHNDNICPWHLPVIMPTSVCDTYLS